MTIFSSAFTLERNLISDVNVRTGAFNVSVALATLPTCWDPSFDYTLYLQFQPGGGFSRIEWLLNLPSIDLSRGLLTTVEGQALQLGAVDLGLVVRYPRFENTKILSQTFFHYVLHRDDRSAEYFDQYGRIILATNPLGHQLLFDYFPLAGVGYFPRKISNSHGDSVSFSEHVTNGHVDVTTTIQGQVSVVRIQLRSDGVHEFVASISLPDRFDEVFKFEYEYPEGKPRRMMTLLTPIGLEKKLTYTQLPISDSEGSVDAVQSITIRDLSDVNAPARVFQYSYSQKNYLGYQPGVSPVSGGDRIFTILDDSYKYSVDESEFTGTAQHALRISRTFNRFHLLEKEEIKADDEAFIAEVRNYSYPIKAGLALENQDPQLTLATEIKRTLTEGGSSIVLTTTQTFNAAGNLLTRKNERGALETRTYSKFQRFSDPLGLYCPLASVELTPWFEWTKGKRIELEYDFFLALQGVYIPAISAVAHFSMNAGVKEYEYTQHSEYMNHNEGLTPSFYVGSPAAIYRKIQGGDKLGRQEFKWVNGPGDIKMIEYSYGASNVIQGGRVQYNWRRQPLLAYDANGFKTIYTYDTLGQITQKTTFADTPKAQTATYVYRHWGSEGSNDVVVTVPGERAVLHKFNAHGNEVRTEISVPPGLAVPSGWQTVQSTKYDARQLPIEIKGRDFYCLLAAESGAWRESTTLNNYDTYRRITRIEQPDGVYDEFIYNRATFKQERRRLGSTTPAERWEYTADGKIYFYDQLSTDGSGAAVSSSAAFAYDGHGRLIRTLDPLPIGSPGPFAISKYAYDYHDRLVSEQHYTSPAWDAQPTDPCKRITYTYDPMLRAWNMGLITKLTADSNKPGTEFIVATRSYDTAGRCLTEDDGAGRTSTYSYPNDGEQRPSKMVDASGAGYEQTFDSITGAITQLSLLTTGQRYAFTWDSVSRLIGVKLQDAQGAVLNAVTFAYDDFGRRNEERTAGADYSLKTLTIGGRLASASGGGDVHCFYDDCGRLTRKVYEKPNPSVPLKMEINIAYSQSSGGTMSRMTLSDTEAGMVASIDFAHVDGRETSRTYTIANQERLKIQSYYADPTTKLRQRNYVIAPLSATLEERYAFDALNRLSGIDYKKTVGTTVSQASATFGFDEHARIQTVSGSNLAGPVNASYTYQARSATGGPDMLTSITQSGSTQSIGYQRGSMSNASGIAAMQYSDTQNLLSAANTNAADPDDLKIQCTYDALNRFAKSVVTQTRPHALSHEVNYVFADGTITGEFAQPVPGDASKSERTRFLRANGVLLGRIVMRPNPPTTVASFAEIFATDSKGSVMGVFAYQGATVMKSTYYTYDAYGQRTEFNA